MTLDIITAPNISVPHGFIGRTGGFSQAPYNSLNLGLNTDDNIKVVEKNQDLVLGYFDKDRQSTCLLKQIHSDRVVEGKSSWFEEEADAIVSSDSQLLLVIGIADCLPILFHDPIKKVVAAAHCGWRGTVKGIVSKTLKKMVALYDSNPSNVQVAMGMCIQARSYQVGYEVITNFLEANFPQNVYSGKEGKYYLDLVAANYNLLISEGVLPQNIWDSGLCTFSDAKRFFSHRRDKGRTGRHWAVICLSEAKISLDNKVYVREDTL